MPGPVTDAERLSIVERDLRDHARTLTAHNDALAALEADRVERRILAAREEERDRQTAEWRDAVRRDVDEVKRTIKMMEDTLNKFAWRILLSISGIVGTAFLIWLVAGRFPK